MKQQGEIYHTNYGDQAAHPRAESKLRQLARDMTGRRVGHGHQDLEISGPPVDGSFGAETCSNAVAFTISERASPDQLYGPDGGLYRLATCWQRQDRVLEPGRVMAGTVATLRKPRKVAMVEAARAVDSLAAVVPLLR